jgi:hypothetical protein
MDSLTRVAVAFGLFAALAWAMVGYSVAEAQRPPAETPLQQHLVPGLHNPGGSGGSLVGSGSGDDLSQKLDRSGGVIRPPLGIDPAITQLPPQAGRHSMPVIPPPCAGDDEGGAK